MNIAVKHDNNNDDKFIPVFKDASAVNQQDAVDEIDKYISAAFSLLDEVSLNPHENITTIITNLNAARKTMLRLIKAKKEFPFPTAFVRHVNNGNRAGIGRDDILDRLMLLRGQKVSLKGGKLTSTTVYKQATSMADALHWLEANIAEANCAAKNSSLINPTNSAKYAETLHRINTGKADLFVSDEEKELRRILALRAAAPSEIQGAEVVDRTSPGLEKLAANNAFVVLS